MLVRNKLRYRSLTVWKKNHFSDLPFIKSETAGMSEITSMNWDCNIVLLPISVRHLITRTDTRLLCNKCFCSATERVRVTVIIQIVYHKKFINIRRRREKSSGRELSDGDPYQRIKKDFTYEEETRVLWNKCPSY